MSQPPFEGPSSGPNPGAEAEGGEAPDNDIPNPQLPEATVDENNDFSNSDGSYESDDDPGTDGENDSPEDGSIWGSDSDPDMWQRLQLPGEVAFYTPSYQGSEDEEEDEFHHRLRIRERRHCSPVSDPTTEDEQEVEMASQRAQPSVVVARTLNLTNAEIRSRLDRYQHAHPPDEAEIKRLKFVNAALSEASSYESDADDEQSDSGEDLCQSSDEEDEDVEKKDDNEADDRPGPSKRYKEFEEDVKDDVVEKEQEYERHPDYDDDNDSGDFFFKEERGAFAKPTPLPSENEGDSSEDEIKQEDDDNDEEKEDDSGASSSSEEAGDDDDAERRKAMRERRARVFMPVFRKANRRAKQENLEMVLQSQKSAVRRIQTMCSVLQPASDILFGNPSMSQDERLMSLLNVIKQRKRDLGVKSDRSDESEALEDDSDEVKDEEDENEEVDDEEEGSEVDDEEDEVESEEVEDDDEMKEDVDDEDEEEEFEPSPRKRIKMDESSHEPKSVNSELNEATAYVNGPIVREKYDVKEELEEDEAEVVSNMMRSVGAARGAEMLAKSNTRCRYDHNQGKADWQRQKFGLTAGNGVDKEVVEDQELVTMATESIRRQRDFYLNISTAFRNQIMSDLNVLTSTSRVTKIHAKQMLKDCKSTAREQEVVVDEPEIEQAAMHVVQEEVAPAKRNRRSGRIAANANLMPMIDGFDDSDDDKPIMSNHVSTRNNGTHLNANLPGPSTSNSNAHAREFVSPMAYANAKTPLAHGVEIDNPGPSSTPVLTRSAKENKERSDGKEARENHRDTKDREKEVLAPSNAVDEDSGPSSKTRQRRSATTHVNAVVEKKTKKQENGTSTKKRTSQRVAKNTKAKEEDEPTYCFCNRISFGEMIGCDNEKCEIEWFHFECIGLTTKPKGKWYCPNCRHPDSARLPKPVSINATRNNSRHHNHND